MPGHQSVALHSARYRDPAWSQSREEAEQRKRALPCPAGTERQHMEQSMQGTTLELVLPSTESPTHLSLLPPRGICSLPPEGAHCGRSSLEPLQGRNGRRVPRGASCKSAPPGGFSETVFPRTGNQCCQKLSGDCCTAGDSIFHLNAQEGESQEQPR